MHVQTFPLSPLMHRRFQNWRGWRMRELRSASTKRRVQRLKATPRAAAVPSNDAAMVRRLLQGGADAGAIDSCGRIPWRFAQKRDSKEFCANIIVALRASGNSEWDADCRWVHPAWASTRGVSRQLVFWISRFAIHYSRGISSCGCLSGPSRLPEGSFCLCGGSPAAWRLRVRARIWSSCGLCLLVLTFPLIPPKGPPRSEFAPTVDVHV